MAGNAMTAYYNEMDSFAAQWLRNLIAAGHIAPGDVDERDILDVSPDDLRGYRQHHFFAGIGGWSYALRLAGWADERPVWTGSCPCQPFSQAGKGKGIDDERHLWPAWFWLIQKCRPPVIFGEQVEAAIQHGWLDLISTDLEGEGYAVGAAILPAACLEAPHGRHRLWFVAESQRSGREAWHLSEPQTSSGTTFIEQSSGPFLLDYSDCPGPQSRDETAKTAGYGNSTLATDRNDHWLLGNANSERWKIRVGVPRNDGTQTEQTTREATQQTSAWSTLEWLFCRDGKWRPTQPGLFPLAHRIPARVGRLRAYGNAIVPQVAAVLIREWLISHASENAS